MAAGKSTVHNVGCDNGEIPTALQRSAALSEIIYGFIHKVRKHGNETVALAEEEKEEGGGRKKNTSVG